jgi:hypothetical protein
LLCCPWILVIWRRQCFMRLDTLPDCCVMPGT